MRAHAGDAGNLCVQRAVGAEKKSLKVKMGRGYGREQNAGQCQKILRALPPRMIGILRVPGIMHGALGRIS